MKLFSRKLPTAVALILASSLILHGALAASSDHPAEQHKVNPAPSADLSFQVQARQSGFSLGGTASVNWRAADRSYSLHTETRSGLFGKILDAQSDGQIDQYGLAPNSFKEKRIRRDPIQTTFDRENKTIRFSASADTYPILGGEQDRNSAMWQLIAIARATPNAFKSGSSWAFFVAGQHDAEAWTFRVIGQETLHTSLGDLSTVHISKEPPPDAKAQQVDIWLTPSREWYPARIRIAEADGDYIEQTLENISKVGS